MDRWNEKSSKIYAAIISVQHVELLKAPMSKEVVQYSVPEEASPSMEHVNKLKISGRHSERSPLRRSSQLVSTGCGVPVATQREVPTIRTMQKTVEISQVQHIDKDPYHRGQVCRSIRRLMAKSS